MKFYKSVIRRTEEDNYKKGVVHLDMNSGYYKTGNLLYTVSFAWSMFFQVVLLFAHSDFMLIHRAENATVDMTLYITAWGVFAALVAGFVLLKFKLHLFAVPLNIAACVVYMKVLYENEGVATHGFLENGILNNKYFWFYFAPAILIILFSLMLLAIYINDRINFRRDYNRSMASMLDDYKKENPAISDIEWQQHLKELDAKIKETEKTSTNKKSRKE